MDALKVFIQQLFKNFEKQPGWIPLLVLCYVLVSVFHLPEYAARLFELPRLSSLPAEVLAVLLTYVFYILGDALDKAIFKKQRPDGSLTDRFKPAWLSAAREHAQATLGVREGIYAASIALSNAADKEFPRLRIHIANESAKFLRSLVIPLLAISLYLLSQTQFLFFVLLVLLAAASSVAYVYLKLWHMHELYAHVVRLKRTNHLHEALLENVCLFFWDGVFAGSATLTAKRPH